MKYLILFILLFIVWVYLKKSLKDGTMKDKKLVSCSQCGMYLPQEDAKKEINWGKTNYFCSDECEKKYVKSGEQNN